MAMKTKNIFIKSVLSVLFIFILSLFIISCNVKGEDNKVNPDDEKKAALKEVKSEVISEIPLELKEGDSLSFTTSKKGVTITYKSSNEAVITNTGIVYFPTSDVFVTLELEFVITLSTGEYKETSSTIIVVRSCKSEEEKFLDIKDDIIKSIPKVVKENITFKDTSLYNSHISYSTSNEEVLSSKGLAKSDVLSTSVTIFVEVELNGKLYEPFEIDVEVKTKEVDSMTEQKLVEIEMEVLDYIEFGKVTEDIELLHSSVYSSTIRYESSDEEALTSDGKVGLDVENKSVTLYFYITLDNEEYGPFSINIVVNTHIKTNDNEYYDEIGEDLRGSSLKMALRSLITKTQERITTYDDIKTVTAKTDADPEKPGNIILFYSRVSVSAKWDGGSTWNREHIWPRSKSWFQYEDAGSDIHHLRPANPSINSSRGNKAYANTTTSSSYAPTDVVKGDVARIVFYLLTRYPESDNYPITNVASSMQMLLEWNELDPVDNLEITRNEECFKLQGNRNPFIDFPEYAEMIWGTINLSKPHIIDNYVQIIFVNLEEIEEYKMEL